MKKISTMSVVPAMLVSQNKLVISRTWIISASLSFNGSFDENLLLTDDVIKTVSSVQNESTHFETLCSQNELSGQVDDTLISDWSQVLTSSRLIPSDCCRFEPNRPGQTLMDEDDEGTVEPTSIPNNEQIYYADIGLERFIFDDTF